MRTNFRAHWMIYVNLSPGQYMVKSMSNCNHLFRQSTLLNSFSERLPIKKNGESGEIEDEQSGKKKKTTHKLFSIMSSCDRELECKTEQVG